VTDKKPIMVSNDQHLLSKVVPAKSIQRHIDWKALGITEESIKAHRERKEIIQDGRGRWCPDHDASQEQQDRFYIHELCLPYNPPPDDRDVFSYYNDMACLSGTAGYLRIRDGYVWGQKVVWRS
jgi:hypothetical protein